MNPFRRIPAGELSVGWKQIHPAATIIRPPTPYVNPKPQRDMAIKTIDMNFLADMTGNVYKSVAILAKRSRQISTQQKAELDEKLAYFEGFEQELEDPRFQEEQAKVSIEYERKPEPTELAIDEMIEQEIYFRDPADEDGEE